MLTYNIISSFVEKVKNLLNRKGNTLEVGGDLEIDGKVIVNNANDVVDKDGIPIAGDTKLYKHSILYRSGTNGFCLDILTRNDVKFTRETFIKYLKENYNDINQGKVLPATVKDGSNAGICLFYPVDEVSKYKIYYMYESFSGTSYMSFTSEITDYVIEV